MILELLWRHRYNLRSLKWDFGLTCPPSQGPVKQSDFIPLLCPNVRQAGMTIRMRDHLGAVVDHVNAKVRLLVSQGCAHGFTVLILIEWMLIENNS